MNDDDGPARMVGRLRKPPPPERMLNGSAPPSRTHATRDIWRSRTDWPFVPSRYFYVPDVFERIGKDRFGDAWTGEESTFWGNVNSFPRPSTVFDGDTDVIASGENYGLGKRSVSALLGIDLDRRLEPLTNDEWCRATDRWMHLDAFGPGIVRRREQIFDEMHRAAEAGELVFYVRHEGEMLPVKRKNWNCNVSLARQRFRQGLLNDVAGEFLPLFKSIPFFGREDQLAEFLGQAPTIPKASILKEGGSRKGRLRGRPPGSGGYNKADQPLVEQMHQMLLSGEASSPHAAAVQLAPSAVGGGTDDAKAKRLLRRYQEQHEERIGDQRTL